jgi:hypothetical protein
MVLKNPCDMVVEMRICLCDLVLGVRWLSQAFNDLIGKIVAFNPF